MEVHLLSIPFREFQTSKNPLPITLFLDATFTVLTMEVDTVMSQVAALNAAAFLFFDNVSADTGWQTPPDP